GDHCLAIDDLDLGLGAFVRAFDQDLDIIRRLDVNLVALGILEPRREHEFVTGCSPPSASKFRVSPGSPLPSSLQVLVASAVSSSPSTVAVAVIVSTSPSAAAASV